MSSYSINELTAVKPLDSYTQDQLNNIKILSLRKHKLADPFGSAVYRIQKYPADLDLHEVFAECCSIDEVVSVFERKIKKIAKDIKKTKLHYFSEFKAGLDIRYDVDVGPISNGIYKPNKDLLNFPANLLNKKERDVIFKILEIPNPGGDEYDILFNLFRERRILRWKEDEIIKGEKILPDNKKMRLHNALKMKSHVKIDMISLVNNQFIEVTDFYILVASHEEFTDDREFSESELQNYSMINLDYDYLDPITARNVQDIQLKQEIEKLYYSNMFYSPFKMSKRMWAYSRSFHLDNSVKTLLPLVSGDISNLYQLVSELDSILRISELKKKPPIKNIDKAIDLIKYKMANILILADDDLMIANYMIKVFLKKHNFDILDKLKKYLKSIVNVCTIMELEKINYNPPPLQFLPNKLKYAPIIRSSYEIVQKP